MPPALPCPDSCVMLLLRHGATENNVARPLRLQGCRSDLPLSAEGRIQAERTAAYLARYRLDAIYSSPLLRAQQTSAAIAARHGLPVETISELTEVDVGEWEGRAWEEIERREADAHRAFMENPAVNPYRGGESLNQVHE